MAIQALITAALVYLGSIEATAGQQAIAGLGYLAFYGVALWIAQ